jgi:hypothetical protein
MFAEFLFYLFIIRLLQSVIQLSFQILLYIFNGTNIKEYAKVAHFHLHCLTYI